MPYSAAVGTSVAAPWPVSCVRSAASCSSRPVKERTGGGIVHARPAGTAGSPSTELIL